MRAIQQVGRVEALGPYTPFLQKIIGQIINQLSLRVFNKRFDYRHSSMYRNAYGRYFSKRLKQGNYNLVIVSGSTAAAAGLKTSLPVIYINDRCIAGAIGYHAVLKQLWSFSFRQSIETDRLAVINSRLTLYSSHWAANAATLHHKVSDDKVKVLPFGANLDKDPDEPEEIFFPPLRLKLLFVGVSWKDKGGPIALQTLEHLLAAGIDAELVICGCLPPIQHPNMRVLGFLNKNIPEQFSILLQEFRTSHFFILPTLYEAYGLVFCEAAAYGLPALAPETGGIPTIIQHNKTGFLLPPGSNGTAYAKPILELLQQPHLWQAMRKAARKRYAETLNWKSWTNEFQGLVDSIGIQ